MPGDYVEIKLRLYRGRDDDLIRWWLNLEAPHGSKTWMVKEVLRRGLDVTSDPTGAGVASIDPEAVAKAMENVMERFLVEMRRVVEAALESAPGGRSHVEEEETDEGKALLEDFLSGLRLEDDDE